MKKDVKDYAKSGGRKILRTGSLIRRVRFSKKKKDPLFSVKVIIARSMLADWLPGWQTEHSAEAAWSELQQSAQNAASKPLN